MQTLAPLDCASIAFFFVDCETGENFFDRVEDGAAWPMDALRAHCERRYQEAWLRDAGGYRVARVMCDGSVARS